MSLNMLIISPYEGMQIHAKQICKEMTKNYANVHFYFALFDRHENESELEDIISKRKYDLILSRGGTAALVKKKASHNVDVIDIGISQYDILKIVHSAARLRDLVFIGFPQLTKVVAKIMSEFQISIPTFTIKNNSDLPRLLTKAKNNNFKSIICDATVEAYAQEYKLNTIFLISSKETIHGGIAQGCKILELKYKANQKLKMYSYFLNTTNSLFAIFDQEKRMVEASTKIKQIPELLINTKNSLMQKKEHFTFKKDYYEVKKSSFNGFFFLKLNKVKTWYETNQEHMAVEYITENEEAGMFDQIQQIAYGSGFFKSLRSYSLDSTPILLIGEKGLGKNYLALQISKQRYYEKNKAVCLDFSDKKMFKQLLSEESSVLYDTDNVLVLHDFNLLPFSIQKEFLNFAKTTKLAQRKKLVFVFEQSVEEGIKKELYQLIQQMHVVPIDPIRNIIGESMVLMATKLLNDYVKHNAKTITGISDLGLDFILHQQWEGNFVQFIDALNTALSSTSESELGIHDLEEGLAHSKKVNYLYTHAYGAKQEQTSGSDLTSLREQTSQIILNTLFQNNGNKAKTARQLQISRATLWRYLKDKQ